MAEKREQSNLITLERMQSFRLCNRLHDYMFLRGYRPVEPLYERRSSAQWPALVSAGLRAVMELGFGDARAYEMFEHAATAAIRATPFSAAKTRCYVRCMRRILEECQFFRTHEVLAVDKPYLFPHMNPDTGRVSPLWLRAGKIDAVVRHSPTGRIRVMEHRITDSPIEIGDVFWSYLSLDGHISQSILGAEVAFPGMRVDEVVFTAVRKTALRPLKATPSASRKLKKDGTPYASTRDRDETASEYEKRLGEDDFQRDMPKHFRMQVVPRTERQIVEHLRNAWSLSQLMREDRNNGWSVQNPDACHSDGEACAFFGVCTGQASLDDPNRYVRLDCPHPELGPDFDDMIKSLGDVGPSA